MGKKGSPFFSFRGGIFRPCSGILRKAGYEVKNADFFKIGIPFTMAAVIPAYIYLWLLFGM